MSQIFNNQNVHLQKNNLHNNSHNMVNTKDLCIYFRYISIYLYLFQIYINNNLTILIMVQARGVSAQLMVSVCTRKVLSALSELCSKFVFSKTAFWKANLVGPSKTTDKDKLLRESSDQLSCTYLFHQIFYINSLLNYAVFKPWNNDVDNVR